MRAADVVAAVLGADLPQVGERLDKDLVKLIGRQRVAEDIFFYASAETIGTQRLVLVSDRYAIGRVSKDKIGGG